MSDHQAITQLRCPGRDLQWVLDNLTGLTGIFGEHLRRYSVIFKAQPLLVRALTALLKAPGMLQLDSKSAYQLSSLGIIVQGGAGCQFTCKLYQRHFEAELGKQAQESAQVVDALQKENEQLQALAYTDALTQIPNRRAFDLRMVQSWQHMLKAEAPLTLMLADIDHFKHYNDTHGHPVGDACLQLVAKILRKQVRSSLTDFVARYGGEEFAVILPNISINVAHERAEQLRSQVKVITDAANIPGVTISIGVASVLPTLEGSAARLLEAVDRVLYESKRLGRDRVTMISTLP